MVRGGPACVWSCNPDGRHVVTGSGFYRENDGEKPDNVGEIKVWDAAIRKCVEEYRGNLSTDR